MTCSYKYKVMYVCTPGIQEILGSLFLWMVFFVPG